MEYEEFLGLLESRDADEASLLELLRDHAHEERFGCELCEYLPEHENKSVAEMLLANQTSRLQSKSFERAIFDVFKSQRYEDNYWSSLIAQDIGLSDLADEEMFNWALDGVNYRANLEYEYEFEADDAKETLSAIKNHPLYDPSKARYTVDTLARDIHNQRCLDGIDACEGKFETCPTCQEILGLI